MTVVTVHEAKTNLSKLIAEAMAGGEVVIARGKDPAVKLVPVAPVVKPKRKLGQWRGKAAFDERFFDPLPESEIRLWQGGDE